MMHFHEDENQGKTPKQIEDTIKMLYIAGVSICVIAILLGLTLLFFPESFN